MRILFNKEGDKYKCEYSISDVVNGENISTQ